jgi:hypothetical protein
VITAGKMLIQILNIKKKKSYFSGKVRLTVYLEERRVKTSRRSRRRM